jgi:hypothetical protein
VATIHALPLTTSDAASALGVSYHQLFSLIRFRKIEPPARNGSGDYCWTRADLERARAALSVRRACRAD